MRYDEEFTKENMKQAETNKLKFYAKEGFSKEGVSYIFFSPDSYERKEELKQQGFRFSKTMMWHCDHIPEGYENEVFEIAAASLVELYVWGGAFLPTAASLIKKMIKDRQPKVESESTWFGEDKQRYYDVPVTFISSRQIETKFGLTNLHVFETEDKCLLQWWTQCQIQVEVGSKVLLTMTVKENGHIEFRDVKYTIVTRCKIKAE